MANDSGLEESTNSKPRSNKSFDALIDLLGSDDVMEDPRFCDQRPNHGELRDPDGKLHFRQIHPFFSSAPMPFAARKYATGESTDRPDNMCGVGGSVIVLSTPPLESGTDFPCSAPGTSLSRSNNSISEDGSSESDVSQCEPVSFGGPISPQHAKIGTIQHNFCMVNTQRQGSSGTVDVAPQFPANVGTPIKETLGAEALNQALTLANEEVVELRRQCDQLRTVVSRQRDTGECPLNSPALQPISNSPDRSQNHDASTWRRSFATLPTVMNRALPPDIAELTEYTAKQALAFLLRSLSLSPSCLFDSTTSISPLSSGHSPTNIGDVQRALDFVLQTDELVWRRSVHTSIGGGPTAPVFDNNNMVALAERLTLWEQIIRGSH